jgi:hypothetical protein
MLTALGQILAVSTCPTPSPSSSIPS